jgi:hypothetical protein
MHACSLWQQDLANSETHWETEKSPLSSPGAEGTLGGSLPASWPWRVHYSLCCGRLVEKGYASMIQNQNRSCPARTRLIDVRDRTNVSLLVGHIPELQRLGAGSGAVRTFAGSSFAAIKAAPPQYFFTGAAHVVCHLTRSVGRLIGAACVATMVFGLSGCGQEGAESIKIENPNAARAKAGGGEVKTKKPLGSDAAKVKEQEQNAPTKHFQRG